MGSWVNQAVFYHIYPLGFCGAPQYNKNEEVQYRLDKLEQWIPHLKEMNVSALYLGPLFQSSEHGYDTKDYYQVDSRLGDNASFKRICETLHQNGIRIVLDGVFNHVGREFWAFQDVQRNGQGSRYCSWFHNLNFGGGSPMGDPFWYEAWEGHYNLVKLNLRNPEVADHILDAVGMWMDEFGIDGLRLDAVDCVDMDFLRRLRTFCKHKREDFWLMGEIIHGDYNRWANPEMLDSVTNYECYKGIYSSHNDKNYFEIAHSLNRQFGSGGIYQSIYTYNFVDNHDVNRLASTLRNPAHIDNVYTLLYTMPGVPSVYYGSEWGLQGIKQNGSDAALRPCLEIGCIQDADYRLAGHIASLGGVRFASPALQTGRYEQVIVKNEQLVYRRASQEQTIAVALNLADCEARLDFPCGGRVLCDLLHPGDLFEVENGRVSVLVPPFSARILEEREQPLSAEQVQQLCETGQTEGVSQTEGDAVCCPAQVQAPQQEQENQRRTGRYRHFKGNEYRVIGFARHSETGEELVVYQQLYGEHALWVRPAEMFFEIVERDGQRFPRFSYLGE